MVKYEYIVKAMDLYITKCPTIDQMRERLATMYISRGGSTDNKGYNGIREELNAQQLLNPLEDKDYINKSERFVETLDELDLCLRRINDEEYDDDFMNLMHIFQREGMDKDDRFRNEDGKLVMSDMTYALFDKLILERDGIEEDLFKYNRRLFEGVKRSEPPQVDVDRFKVDEPVEGNDFDKSGQIETATSQAQQKALNLDVQVRAKTDENGVMREVYTGKDWESVKAYNDYVLQLHNQGINSHIGNAEYISRLDKEHKKMVKDMDKLMNGTDGLTEDTMLYRGGYWDIHLNVGDHSKGFNGYQSTSFRKEVGERYVDNYSDKDTADMLIQILAPKGTKGIASNDPNFNTVWDAHEFVLARNTGFTVLDIDYDNMVATIVLDDPK